MGSQIFLSNTVLIQLVMNLHFAVWSLIYAHFPGAVELPYGLTVCEDCHSAEENQKQVVEKLRTRARLEKDVLHELYYYNRVQINANNVLLGRLLLVMWRFYALENSYRATMQDKACMLYRRRSCCHGGISSPNLINAHFRTHALREYVAPLGVLIRWAQRLPGLL
jgi:hypothetical protein